VFTAAESTPTPISKAGKQPAEDPSVGVIKSILKYVLYVEVVEF